MDRITVTVTNWNKWNPRKDYRKPSWFAMSNSLLDDPDFADFTPLEFHALVYIFSQASKKNSATVDLVMLHARQRNINDKVLLKTIDKLKSIQILAVICTDSERDTNGSVQDLYSTENTENTENTGRTGRVKSPGSGDRLPLLAKIWNKHAGELGLVKSSTKTRDQKSAVRLSEASESDWADTVKRIAESSFCRGENDRGWRASFDWLLQPETRLKVQEGKYDNRNGKESHDDWMAKTIREHEERKASIA